MVNKKGVGHIEMIMSFVLFFLFVIFMLAYIRPYGSGALSTSVVTALHEQFYREGLTNYTSFFLKADYFGDGVDCYRVVVGQELFSYTLEGVGSKAFVAVSGEAIGSKMVNGVLSLEDDNVFYDVVLSPDLENGEGLVGCSDFEGEMQLGSIDERQIISEAAVMKIKDSYENDYETLKKNLELPEAFDFAIVSDFVSMERVIPEAADVVAEDYIEEVMMVDGKIETKRFTFKVW